MPRSTGPQVNLRLSAALKERIEAAAAKNKRSMNAEIVDRLERSLELLVPNEHIDMSKLPPEALEEAANRAMELLIERHPDIFGTGGKRK